MTYVPFPCEPLRSGAKVFLYASHPSKVPRGFGQIASVTSPEASKEAISEFLSSAVYSADQITFINQIVDHLVHNGLMEPKELFEAPFTDMHDQGVVGVLAEAAQDVVEVIEAVNRNAEVA